MKDTELKHMRDEALYEEYLIRLRTGSFSSLDEIADSICTSGRASQYYIEARQVSLYIGMIESGISLIRLNESSRRRVKDLYSCYLIWRALNPESDMPRERVCEILVQKKAPSFYLSRDSIRKIIQRMRVEKCKRWN